MEESWQRQRTEIGDSNSPLQVLPWRRNWDRIQEGARGERIWENGREKGPNEPVGKQHPGTGPRRGLLLAAMAESRKQQQGSDEAASPTYLGVLLPTEALAWAVAELTLLVASVKV